MRDLPTGPMVVPFRITLYDSKYEPPTGTTARPMGSIYLHRYIHIPVRVSSRISWLWLCAYLCIFLSVSQYV